VAGTSWVTPQVARELRSVGASPSSRCPSWRPRTTNALKRLNRLGDGRRTSKEWETGRIYLKPERK